MATIGKIRERSGLVIAVIGLAMLGFIATDLFSNNSIFRGSGPKGIGRIYGGAKAYKYQEYCCKVFHDF